MHLDGVSGQLRPHAELGDPFSSDYTHALFIPILIIKGLYMGLKKIIKIG